MASQMTVVFIQLYHLMILFFVVKSNSLNSINSLNKLTSVFNERIIKNNTFSVKESSNILLNLKESVQLNINNNQINSKINQNKLNYKLNSSLNHELNNQQKSYKISKDNYRIGLNLTHYINNSNINYELNDGNNEKINEKINQNYMSNKNYEKKFNTKISYYKSDFKNKFNETSLKNFNHNDVNIKKSVLPLIDNSSFIENKFNLTFIKILDQISKNFSTNLIDTINKTKNENKIYLNEIKILKKQNTSTFFKKQNSNDQNYYENFNKNDSNYFQQNDLNKNSSNNLNQNNSLDLLINFESNYLKLKNSFHILKNNSSFQYYLLQDQNTHNFNTKYIYINNLSDFNLSNSDFKNQSLNEPVHEKVYWGISLIFLPFCAVFGNCLVILAVYKEKSLRSVTNYFIVSLAFADLLVAGVVMPFAVYYLVNIDWELSDVLCDFWMSVDVMCSTASILNLVAISIDRYIAVTQPIKYAKHKSNNRVACTIAIVWIVSLLIGCPIWLGLNTSEERTSNVCIFVNSDFIIYSSLGSFYIPCCLMVFLYYRIFKEIRKRSKRTRIKNFTGNTSSSGHVNKKTDAFYQSKNDSYVNVNVNKNQLIGQKKTKITSDKTSSQLEFISEINENQCKYKPKTNCIRKYIPLYKKEDKLNNFDEEDEEDEETDLTENEIKITNYSNKFNKNYFNKNDKKQTKICQKLKLKNENFSTSNLDELDENSTNSVVIKNLSALEKTNQKDVNKNSIKRRFINRFDLSLKNKNKEDLDKTISSLKDEISDELKDEIELKELNSDELKDANKEYSKNKIIKKFKIQVDDNDSENEIKNDVSYNDNFNNNLVENNIKNNHDLIDNEDNKYDCEIIHNPSAIFSKLTPENLIEKKSIGVCVDCGKYFDEKKSICIEQNENKQNIFTLEINAGSNKKEKSYNILDQKEDLIKNEIENFEILENQIAIEYDSQLYCECDHQTNINKEFNDNVLEKIDNVDSESKKSFTLHQNNKITEKIIKKLKRNPLISLPSNLKKTSSSSSSVKPSYSTNHTESSVSFKNSDEKINSKTYLNKQDILDKDSTNISIKQLSKKKSCFYLGRKQKNSRKKQEKASAKRERKATKTLAIVLGVFLFCWVPFFSINIMDAICIKLQANDCKLGISAFLFATWLGYINSCINPIIYTIFNTEFRKVFIKILGL